ncbi:hypothetical protein RF11_03807 [Thelohanellus kitauei]|uniref:Uncharacterized protein n=1 Tax=Thelohanellus kitauei TaxID=669202 RepID=A0A0C2IU03_THEKT|nr:hypothetical protein RF11_03807 [Thelohanellus kitauei]
MIELQNHNVSRLLHANKSHTGSVTHHICKSGVMLIVYDEEPGVWSRFHHDKTMFYDAVGIVVKFITSDYTPHDFALLTDDNTVRHIITFSYITLINHRKDGLRFEMIVQNRIDTEDRHASLKFWDSTSKTVSDLLQRVVNYGSSDSLFWAFVKTNNYNTLQFLVNNQYKDAYFGDIYIDDITNVSVQNQMILVRLIEEKKSTVSVWISDINDLKFTKISSLMLGVDTDGYKTSYGYIKIDYNFYCIEKMPGLIFISQASDRDGIKQKLTTVSYNYGNTFVPIKYKPRMGHCEWVTLTNN